MRSLKLLLVALVAVTSLVACSDDEPAADPGATDSTSETEEGGATVTGDGFTFTAPTGWTDVADQAQQSNPQVDVAVVSPEGKTFHTNFNTVTPNPDPGLSREQLVTQASKELGGVTGSEVVPIEDRDFDGETAIGQTSTMEQGSTSLVLVQYLILHEDKVYATTITFADGEEESAQAALDGIISSWSWA